MTAAYSRVPFEGVELFRKPDDRSLGYTGKGKIYLNAFWFAQPRAAFDTQVMKARSSAPPGYPPWHGRIGGFDHEVERLITHEFGHLLADTLDGYKEFASAGHSAVLADPTMAVSGYALVDPDEWFAEVFSALRLGGSGSVQIVEVDKFLE